MRVRGRVRRLTGDWSEAVLLAGWDAHGDAAAWVAFAEAWRKRVGLTTDRFERGDLVWVDAGFGRGATRDGVALTLSLAGVAGILAARLGPVVRESFLHAGVPCLLAEDVASLVEDGDDCIVNFATGTVEDVTRHRVLVAAPLEPHELQVVRAAPALAWYGVARPAPDPDVVESSRPARPRLPRAL